MEQEVPLRLRGRARLQQPRGGPDKGELRQAALRSPDHRLALVAGLELGDQTLCNLFCVWTRRAVGEGGIGHAVGGGGGCWVVAVVVVVLVVWEGLCACFE